MTWGEFKLYLNQRGIHDSDVIDWIDINHPTRERIDFVRDRDPDDKSENPPYRIEVIDSV